MKQSFSWWCVNNRGIEDKALLEAAKSIGYSAVELIGPSLYDLAIDSGLGIASIGGHESIASGLNDVAQHDRIEREIDINLAVAVKYGIPNLIVMSGNRRDGLTDSQGAEAITTGVLRIIKAAEDAGVTLIMELLNSKVDHAGYQADRTGWLAEIVKNVGSSRFKMLYDIYHMQIMEGDLIRTIRANADHIGHYHTAGNPGRHELNETQEIYYPAVIASIAATGYSGFIGHEFIPAGNIVDGLRHAYLLTEAASG